MRVFFIALSFFFFSNIPTKAQNTMLYANCTEVYDKGDTTICIEQLTESRQLIRYYLGGNNIFSKRYWVEKNGDYSFQAVVNEFDSAKNGIGYYYYKNTQLKAVFHYENDKILRCEAYFDQNGNALEIGTLQNGSGKLFQYDENGKKIATIKYKNGKKCWL